MRFWRRVRVQFINAIPALSHGLFALVPLLWWSAWTSTRINWTLAAGAFIVGNLPDIDTNYSRIGRLVPPLSRFLESRFGHRTITHSLLSAAFVTLIAFLLHFFFTLSLWWWWPVFYASHLLFDMIVGGATGLPLIWPNRRRFWLEIDIRPGSSTERTIFVVLIIAAVLPFTVQLQTLSPAHLLRTTTGSTDIALQDAREWEAQYTVYLEIEGTRQLDRSPIKGQFEIQRIQGNTFYLLNDDNTTFTAGQGNEDVYLTRAVAVKGVPRTIATVTPTPTPTPTPVIVNIRIPHVYAPATEILVQPGDVITTGQLLADLVTYRRLIATPTPTLTPTPGPTPTPAGIDFLAVTLAEAQVSAAQSRLTQAQSRLAKDQSWLEFLEQFTADGWENVDWHEIEYWVGSTSGTMGPRSDIPLHRALDTARYNVEQSALNVAIEQANLAAAQIRLQQALATPIPEPTPMPISIATIDTDSTGLDDSTYVKALVAGRVTSVQIIAVTGNEATVQIEIVVSNSNAAPDDVDTTAQ